MTAKAASHAAQRVKRAEARTTRSSLTSVTEMSDHALYVITGASKAQGYAAATNAGVDARTDLGDSSGARGVDAAAGAE